MKIAVVFHERDHQVGKGFHLVFHLAQQWREMGMEVEFSRGLDGLRRAQSADVLIPHFDCTRTPDVYQEWVDRHPRALNRGVVDISKRGLSDILVTPGDGYDGPVIVKTSDNSGGSNDRSRGTLLGSERFARGLAELSDRWIAWRGVDLATTDRIPKAEYPVFERASDLPPEVYDNRHLVVERFLPEYHDGLYHIRIYLFLGDRHICRRYASHEAVVKNRGHVEIVPIEVDPAIVRRREELGFDFGKFDYVEHEGNAILLDTNRTPGRPGGPEECLNKARTLAPGLQRWWAESGRGLTKS